jgi:hypothetical protein
MAPRSAGAGDDSDRGAPRRTTVEACERELWRRSPPPWRESAHAFGSTRADWADSLGRPRHSSYQTKAADAHGTAVVRQGCGQRGNMVKGWTGPGRPSGRTGSCDGNGNCEGGHTMTLQISCADPRSNWVSPSLGWTATQLAAGSEASGIHSCTMSVSCATCSSCPRNNWAL